MKTEKLYVKWYAAKAKLQKAQAKEAALRADIEKVLVKSRKAKVVVEIDNKNITFSTAENYSIPKAAITDIKENIPAATFTDAFTVSYKLKPTVYLKLSGDCKKKIEEHLTIKPAPIRVSVKEI